jgi:hypothetical protein
MTCSYPYYLKKKKIIFTSVYKTNQVHCEFTHYKKIMHYYTVIFKQGVT